MVKEAPEAGRVIAFSDGVLAVIITVLVLELLAARASEPRGPSRSLADGYQLRGELSLHRHRLDEPSPFAALCGCRDAEVGVGKTFAQSSSRSQAFSILDGMDRQVAFGCAGFALRSRLHVGGHHLSAFVLVVIDRCRYAL